MRRDKSQIITGSTDGMQTKTQLASEYKVSVHTISRDLEGMRYVPKISKYKDVVSLLDKTNWGIGFGLMLIRDAVHKRVFRRKYVKDKTMSDYFEAVS